MKRGFLLFVSLAVIAVQSLIAQNFTVKGTVIEAETNEPLIGVAIMQEGTNNGVTTDIDGNYSIEIKGAAQATLVFSYIGMQQQQHVVTPQTQKLDITLKSDAQLVDEVVVVAYGVRKKGTVTGSVSTVKSEKLESVPAAGFDQALQGQTPGLMVMSNSGEPSKAAAFQIRGTNSINSGTSPLFILDGVPISSSDFNTISPSDIESISVLKDASSTSIYGARAANGVVVITTKRGRAMDKAHITLRTQWGISQLAKGEWNLMNTAERIQFEKEVGLDAGQNYDILSQTDVNWRDMVFNDKAMLQNYDLSISRATEKLNYFVSGSFYDQDGIAQGSTFARYSVRANAEVKASNWLKVGTNSMVTYEEVEQADAGSYSLSSPISACRFMLPYWNPYNPDGSLATNANGGWTGTTVNPIEWMANNPVTNKKYKVLSVLFAEVTPIENLTYRVQFGADFTHSTGFMQSFPSYQLNNGLGVAGRQSNDILNLTVTNTVNYRFDINRDHHFNVMLGQEGVDYRAEGFNVTTRNQNNDYLTNVTSGTRASSWQDNSAAYSFLSFFARAEYNYDDRYYVDLSVRTDASSRFGKDHRWGQFWSLGLMWNAKKEKFLQNLNWLHNAQVSFSTGTSGNSEIPYFDHLALVSGGWRYMDVAGIAPQQKGNEKLSWEKTHSVNVGLDFAVLNQAINLSVDYYYRKGVDLIGMQMLPLETGFSSTNINWASMTNKGIEIGLSTRNIHTKSFMWTTTFNFAYNQNKVLKEAIREDAIYPSREGYPAGAIFAFPYAGIDENGQMTFYNKETGKVESMKEFFKVQEFGFGTYNLSHAELRNKYEYIGTTDSPYTGGFNNTFTYKAWELGINCIFNAGGYVRVQPSYSLTSFDRGQNTNRDILNRWTPENPNGTMPALVDSNTDMDAYFFLDGAVNPYAYSSLWVKKQNYMRIQSIRLGYELPFSLIQKLGISQATVALEGRNLFVFGSSYRNYLDPETMGNPYAQPIPKSFTFSLNLNF